MKKALVAFTALSAFFSTTSAFAEFITGTVANYDRVANQITFQDRTVVTLQGQKVELPGNLQNGSRVEMHIDIPGDNGFTTIRSITVK